MSFAYAHKAAAADPEWPAAGTPPPGWPAHWPYTGGAPWPPGWEAGDVGAFASETITFADEVSATVTIPVAVTESIALADATTETSATQVTLDATADATITEQPANYNYGAATTATVGMESGGVHRRRYLIKFDVSSLAGASTIVSATLRLRVLSKYFVGTRGFSTARIKVDWGEGDNNVSAADAGECSWTWRSNPTTWTWAGCNHPTSDRTSVQNSTDVSGTGWREWDVQPWVEDWVIDGDPNYGLILIADDEVTQLYMTLYSREHATTANRPQLVVTYT